VESTAGTPAFKALAFTGNGAPSRSITGVGFQPDFVWLKNRDKTLSHQIVDVLRGANKALLTNSTNGEDDTQTDFSGGGVETIDADGFTLGDGTINNSNFNGSGDDSIAWCLKAGGAGVSNTDGSITSTVSANTAAGFSIVQWSGNETANTVGHGLTSAPELVIFKSLLTGNWIVGTDFISNTSGWNKQLYLNLSNGTSGTTSASFNNSAPTATVFHVGNSDATNDHGTDSMIAYCWHSVPGYSKIGSYSGSASSTTSASENNYIALGFRPAFIMFKRVTSADDWIIVDNARDTTNSTTTRLQPNKTNQDNSNTYAIVDFETSGFTLRGGNAGLNYTGNTYIYMAFAEEIPGADTIPTTGVLGLAEQYQGKL